MENNIEKLLMDMKPIMINIFIIIGTVVVIIGIAVTIYDLCKKKRTVTSALKQCLFIIGFGLILSTTGILIICLNGIEINGNTSIYRYLIPAEYIIFFCIVVFLISCSKRHSKDDKNNQT